MDEYDLETSPVPFLDRLPEEGVEAIHEASMYIIEDIGIKVDHEQARAAFADAGASVHDDHIVTADRSLIMDAVEDAPSSFTLHGRNPDRNVEVGDGAGPVRAPGYGAPNVLTFEDGRRKSTLDDYETFMKLVQTTDVIHSTGYTVCEPNDVDQEVKHLEMLQRSLSMTDKPVMVSPYGQDRAAANLDMVRIATGDEDLSVPYAVALINTVPPRTLDKKMLGGLIEMAENGQVSVVSAFIQAGASGPVTLAGAMAQANAENLMGIALTQLINPGAPAVYGIPSSNIDMRYGSLSIGSPESALFISFAGQMGRYYDVPSRAGGSLTDAKTVDYHAGFESLLTSLTTEYAGIDYELHAVGILESYSAISPEKFVLDAEVIEYVEAYKDGFAINEDTLALDLIESIDTDDHFMSQRHTLTHSKTDIYRPDHFDKRSHGDWKNDGSKTAFELGRDIVTEKLDAYEEPSLPADVLADLEAFVEEAKTRAY